MSLNLPRRSLVGCYARGPCSPGMWAARNPRSFRFQFRHEPGRDCSNRASAAASARDLGHPGREPDPAALAVCFRSTARRTGAIAARADVLDLAHLKNAQIGFPAMKLKQRGVVAAELLWQCGCTRNDLMRSMARRRESLRRCTQWCKATSIWWARSLGERRSRLGMQSRVPAKNTNPD